MRLSLRLLLVFAVCAATGARATEAPEKNFDLAIVRGMVPAEQRLLKLEKGDALRLRITSDAPGELHLHGYRLEVKLTPSQSAELAFKAHATGRYPFEWHGAQSAAKTGAHHGPPLATLEVRPK